MLRQAFCRSRVVSQNARFPRKPILLRKCTMLCDKFARLCVFVALLVGSIWFPAPANANVIYSDTFTGTDGTALNGHVLDVTTGGAS